MSRGHARASADGAPPAAIIVEGRLAALQWEIHLAAPLLERRARAWPSAPILTYRAWLERLWLAHGRPESRALLGPGQSAALWREIIADSAEGPALLGAPGVAAWAEDAHRSLAAACVRPKALAAARAEDDFAAFLRWRARYLERLDASGWIDAAGLEAELIERAPRDEGPIEIAPPFEPTPAARRLFDALAASGARIATRAVPDGPCRAVRVQLEDGRAEIAAAARWARRRIERSPDARVAVVAAGLRDAASDSEIKRVFAEEGVGEQTCCGYEPAPDTRPAIGAALNALELLS
ncbi:MAG TPA: hypothetical protein VFV10_14710, partial [Gammaproteobacteria bacterium]|nr:hypothetical protein [Gammaproteobacteria bacterium]